jgi:hypothetical protein
MPKLNTSITTTSDIAARRQLLFVATGDLIPDPHNPRKHGRAQISAIARSIESFGFNAPILVDKNNKIVAGHGRYEAAQLLGIDKVPVILLSHLTPTQAKAYLLADNKLTDRSTWDEPKLAIQLKELSDLVLDFDIEAIGFEPPEIDLRIQSLDSALEEADDQFELTTGPVVSKTGDLWLLGSHRLYCGSALDATSYEALSNGEKAAQRSLTRLITSKSTDTCPAKGELFIASSRWPVAKCPRLNSRISFSLRFSASAPTAATAR